MKFTRMHPATIGFFQTVFISLYILFVVFVMSMLEPIFMAKNYNQEFLLPMLTFLSLFCVSALICGLGVFGIPFYTFWDKKKIQKPLSIVFYTAFWGIIFFLSYLLYLAS